MSERFTIDVWSDVICPFCYLGSRQLTLALERFEHRDLVLVRQRAFELDAHAKVSYDQPLAELVARKYDIPVERARALHERMEGEARALGLTWSLARARATNTFDAHRLIALSATQDLVEATSQRLFRAYFSDGELVSDHAVLDRLAREVGVEGSEALWSGDDFAEAVRADENLALELGVTGVPSLLLDGKFMLVGAQGPDATLAIIERAWARRAA